jgi:hypothetical protein
VEAVGVPHANAVEVLLAGVGLDVVPPFKAQRLEQLDGGLRVPGDDERVESRDNSAMQLTPLTVPYLLRCEGKVPVCHIDS